MKYNKSADLIQGVPQVESDVAIIRTDFETVLWRSAIAQRLILDGWKIVERTDRLPATRTPAVTPPVRVVAQEQTAQKAEHAVLTEVSRTVHFAFDSSALTASEKEILRRAPYAQADQIQIDGYTDSIGTSEYNMKLSQRRARVVADFLHEVGVPRSKIQFQGDGESHPQESNKTASGRAANRRTVIVLKVPSGAGNAS